MLAAETEARNEYLAAATFWHQVNFRGADDNHSELDYEHQMRVDELTQEHQIPPNQTLDELYNDDDNSERSIESPPDDVTRHMHDN